MTPRYDLHLHSTWSDGRYPADEVVERCVAGGLTVIALTDHDVVAPVDPGLHHVGGRDVRVIGGAELSGAHGGRELHLLVYFRGEVPTRFQEFCDARVRERWERYHDALRELGLEAPVPPSGRALTRYHLARELVTAGRADSVGDAFRRFLSYEHGLVRPVTFPAVEAIREARALGGVTSWAHPNLDDLERFLSELVAAGLQGLEAARPRIKGRQRRRVRRLARDHGLFLTGGSDWHGWVDEDLGLFSLYRAELRGFLEALEAA